MTAERMKRQGAVICRLMNRAGLSVAATALELGVSQAKVERYCSGTEPVPRVFWLALKQVAFQERRRANRFVDELLASGGCHH